MVTSRSANWQKQALFSSAPIAIDMTAASGLVFIRLGLENKLETDLGPEAGPHLHEKHRIGDMTRTPRAHGVSEGHPVPAAARVVHRRLEPLALGGVAKRILADFF